MDKRVSGRLPAPGRARSEADLLGSGVTAKGDIVLMRRTLQIAAVLIGVLGYGAGSQAADIKVLTTGAMKEVVLAVVPGFEKATGHKVIVSNDTAGALVKRIEGGEGFDLCVLTPSAIKELAAKGKFAAGGTNVARVGVGVVVKAG